MSNADLFLTKALGKDFLESLCKAEIWKPGTKSVNDLEDMKIGLQIVPRTIISLLIRELGPMNVGDNKQIAIFVGASGAATINVTKHERDVYSGDIEQAGKKLTEFKFRSLPGLGLVIMSTFELYDMENLINAPQYLPVPMPPADANHCSSPDCDKIQRMIDERLALHELIGQVIEKKMVQKDAIVQLMLAKLSDEIQGTRSAVKASLDILADQHKMLEETKNKAESALILATNLKVPDTENKSVGSLKKGSPVKNFLAKRQSKKEFVVHMSKGETVGCPDCGNTIFNGTGISTCICFGDIGQVYLKKTENGIKISFSKSWDLDNIEMLLDVLQKKNNG